MRNLIGVSGHIGSGKDTVGTIIRCLTLGDHQLDIPRIISENYTLPLPSNDGKYFDWKIVKFADKLKDIVCLLINCTREELEDPTFKNLPLGEEWTRYGYADGFEFRYKNGQGEPERIMNNVPCSKERYEEELRTNWQTAYKRVTTPRLLLQIIGTECGRNLIHDNIWINSLFANYGEQFKNNPAYNGKGVHDVSEQFELENPPMFPKWIVTDCRFPNEAEAIKSRGGILIRVERELYYWKDKVKKFTTTSPFVEEYEGLETDHETKNHASETSLDTYDKFDYVIKNDGTLDDLVEKIRVILKAEKII